MPAVVSFAKKQQTAGDKAEKNLQSRASLLVGDAYASIICGVILLFAIRNAALQLSRFSARRRRSAQLASMSVNEKKRSAGSIYSSKPALLRVSDRIDAVLSKPVGVWPLHSPDMTWFRFLMVSGIVIINLIACCVVDLQTHFAGTTERANISRSFSRRVGRIATDNLPLLYAFAGRNSFVAMVTGFEYQEIRYYHKVVGVICFLQCFIHTVAYSAYYVKYLGMESLHEEYTELYFKMGIAAMVGAFVACLVGLRAFRSRFYEAFLIMHIISAVLMLMGSWYHRPIMHVWVYAAAAVWAFERAVRLLLHIGSRFHSRIILHRPLIQAEASICHGAIKLSVPFPSGDWVAGQHAYISFWGRDLLRRPHLYGQSHPFSVANIPDSSSSEQTLQFLLRIHTGVTRELAAIIAKKTAASKSSSCAISVSIEGLHGSAPNAEEFDLVMLVAGGSGITHVASILSSVCKKAEEGLAAATKVKLVWAIHRLEQAEWVENILNDCRARADKANLDLDIQIFVTRTEGEDSGRSTPPGSEPSTPSVEDEKESFPAALTSRIGRAVVHRGRPHVAEEVREVIATSAGRTCVVACGPEALANEVRNVTNVMASSDLEVQIAKFEC